MNINYNNKNSSFKPVKHEFIIDVDYSSVYVLDQSYLHIPLPLTTVTNQEVKNLLKVGDQKSFVIYTVRDMDVNFTIETCKSRPEITFDEWDHINECGIYLGSGILYIQSVTDIPEESFNIELPSGYYGGLICYKNLYKVALDRLDGEDSYVLYLWPEDEYLPVKVLKRWPGKGYFE